VDGSLDEQHCGGCPQGTTHDQIVQVRQHLYTEKENCREVSNSFRPLCVHIILLVTKKRLGTLELYYPQPLYVSVHLPNSIKN
jgi:hypothetical protein